MISRRIGGHVLRWLSKAHRAMYTFGILRSVRLKVPTVSVGNFCVGGAGKTPLVKELAAACSNQGLRPLILMRGYGDDEQHLLQFHLLNQREPGKIVAQPNRAQAAQQLLTKEAFDVAILDDGAQHHRIARDMDIVVVNAADPWGRGFLREAPEDTLARASAVVLHNCNFISQRERSRIRQRISIQISTSTLLIETACRAYGVWDMAISSSPTDRNVSEKMLLDHFGTPVIPVSGIANNTLFHKALEDAGFQIAMEKEMFGFRDHYNFTDRDVRRIAEFQTEQNSTEEKPRRIIMTEKDFWRCKEGGGTRRFLNELKPLVLLTETQSLNYPFSEIVQKVT